VTVAGSRHLTCEISQGELVPSCFVGSSRRRAMPPTGKVSEVLDRRWSACRQILASATSRFSPLTWQSCRALKHGPPRLLSSKDCAGWKVLTNWDHRRRLLQLGDCTPVCVCVSVSAGCSRSQKVLLWGLSTSVMRFADVSKMATATTTI
jgi:hypothetical protein